MEHVFCLLIFLVWLLNFTNGAYGIKVSNQSTYLNDTIVLNVSIHTHIKLDVDAITFALFTNFQTNILGNLTMAIVSSNSIYYFVGIVEVIYSIPNNIGCV
jgi:hypothetical protein